MALAPRVANNPRVRRSFFFAFLVAACSTSSSPAPVAPVDAGPKGAPRTDPDAVHVDGRTFRDGRGRQLLFRGYNAKATLTFDAVFDDGRMANETFNDFDDK